MFKPALVIGLGGTGVLTLRHLKAEILAVSRSRELPKHVKLIAIDTVQEGEQSAGGDRLASLRVQLEPGEYYFVGGDVYDFARRVRDDEHPCVGSWLQAGTYLRILQRAAFNLQRGAGQLRQFGRLAIFNDVSNPPTSRIRKMLDNALREIRDTVANLENLDVFVVASVAGGTGAGMFVDLAWIVRQFASRTHSLQTTVRGFLVLPEAFGRIPGGVKDSMRARAAAAMRENKRFMVDFEPDIGYPMFYDCTGNDPVWHGKIQHKLFDYLYHVDGHRKSNPIDKELPEVGVAPSIADAIAAMIDKAQGDGEDIYGQHTTNVMTAAGISTSASVTQTAFDSAVGMYTVSLPIHHIVESLTCRQALEALEVLLAPAQRDESGYPTALSIDANPDSPNVRGRNVALRLLQAAEVQAWQPELVREAQLPEKVSGTPLLQEILRVATAYTPQNTGLVADLATRTVEAWEPHFDPGSGASQIQAMRDRVQPELRSRLQDVVIPSRGGEKPIDALNRILQGVEAYKSTHMGREDPRTGQRVGGKLQEALAEYSAFHLNRYRDMLAIECLNILNGGLKPQDPPSVTRRGKLGYLLDYMGGLEAALGNFIKALNDAHAEREKRQVRQAAEGSVNAARLALQQSPGGFGAGGRQREYLNAEQQLISVMFASLLNDAIRHAAQAMLEHTQTMRKDAENWASVLGLGYDSIYGRLHQARGHLAEMVRADREVKVRDVIWDAAYEQALYEKYAQTPAVNGLDRVLGSWVWQYERRTVGERQEHCIHFAVAGERLGQKGPGRNVQVLIAPARRLFDGVWDQESILGYLMRTYERAEDLGTKLLNNNAPLLELLIGAGTPANYLHVAHGQTPEEGAYLAEVKKRLEASGASGQLNAVINSADRFKMRYVNTLDLIPLDQVASYQRSLPVYRTYTEERAGQDGGGRLGRETLHLFPAEVNATYYESRLGLMAQPIREFANDVVMQLEDLGRLRLFIGCWLYDVIREAFEEEKAGRLRYYLLELLPRVDDLFGGSKPVLVYLTRPTPTAPNMLDALKRFTYVGRDARPDVDIRVNFDDVQRALVAAREARIASLIPRSSLPPAIQSRIDGLSQSSQERVRRNIAEREFLIRKQNEQESAARVPEGTKATRENDLAAVFYLTIADEISALEADTRRLLQ